MFKRFFPHDTLIADGCAPRQLARARLRALLVRSHAPRGNGSARASIELTIHVLLKGGAYLLVDDPAGASELTPGSLALVPGGADHHLASRPRTAAFLTSVSSSNRLVKTHSVTQTRPCSCARVPFPGDVGQGLLRSLPPIPGAAAHAEDSLHQIIALISRELH